MGKELLPPGFRFSPSDVELIMCYLKPKAMCKRIPYDIISERRIYEFSPQDLPGESFLKSRDQEWYFFCRREKKYETGGRMNRTTKWGSWKTTGEDKSVRHENQTVGYRRTLVFHEGQARKRTRTDWVIHEYRLKDEVLANIEIDKDEFVVCKLFHKSGPGPQNGAQYGAQIIEEDWNIEDESDCIKSILFPSMAEPETGLNDIPELQPSENENDENEVDKPSSTQNVTGSEEDDIFCGLGDLSNPHEMRYSTSDAQDQFHTADFYMELLDLDDPLEGPSNGSGSNLVPPSEVCMGHNYSHNPEHFGNPSNGCGVVNHAAASVHYPPALAGRSYGSENRMDVFPKDKVDFTGSFLELHDLDKPLEGPVDGSGVCMDYSCQHDHDHIDQPSNNFGMVDNAAASFHYTTMQADRFYGLENKKKSVGENAKRRYLGLESASYNTEGLEADSGRVVQTHKKGREQTKSYWRLQQLLESIPSRPASAAEHHLGSSCRQEKNTCMFCTSVGVVGGCFDEDEEALSDKLDLACMGHCGCNPNLHRRWKMRDFRKEAAVWDGSVMFVLLLGMLSTLMWVFIATIVVKLGKLAWDLLS